MKLKSRIVPLFLEKPEIDMSQVPAFVEGDGNYFSFRKDNFAQFQALTGMIPVEESRYDVLINQIKNIFNLSSLYYSEVYFPSYIPFAVLQVSCFSVKFICSKKEGNKETLLFFTSSSPNSLKNPDYALFAKLYLKDEIAYREEKQSAFCYFFQSESDYLEVLYFDDNQYNAFAYKTFENNKHLEARVFIKNNPLFLYGNFYSNNKEKFKIFKVGDQKLTEKEMISYIKDFKTIKISDLKTKPLEELLTPTEIAIIEMSIIS